jgi:lipopolysaccharide export system permease protein
MKASGISLARLSLPVIGFAGLVVALSLALNVEWVPWGERSFKSLLIKVGNTQVVKSIKEGTFTTGFFDLLIFADKVDPKTNRMSHVFIYDEREAKNAMTIVARSGELVPVRTQSELGAAALLRLYNGSIHRNDIAGNTYQKIDFREYKLYLKIGEGEGVPTSKPQNFSYEQLQAEIAKHPATTFEGREFRGEKYRRFAMAFTPMLFVFLGIGFGTVRTRAIRAGAALIAMVTLLVYWSVQSFATIQVQRGTIPPLVAMLLPNLVVALAALFSFRRASW